MSLTARAALAALAVSVGLAFAGPAAADGKRDLEDGIAFYENLDTDRAIDRLRSAARAEDLSSNDRARAHMYLGIVLFETGKERDAEGAWQSAFVLSPKVAIPSGTSPKIVQVIERLRSSAKPAPRPTASPSPTASPPDGPRVSAKPSPSPSPTTPPPSLDPTPPIDAPPADLTTPPPAEEAREDEGGGVPGWLIWGGIGAVVVGGAVTAILLATRGPSCDAGACLLVELK